MWVVEHPPIIKTFSVVAEKVVLTLFLSQEATQRRVEKAKILEHTVLFLQNTRDKSRAENCGDCKNSFREGFSTCLQRATQFQGPEGKGLWLGAALDASLSACCSSSHCDSANVQERSEAQSYSSSLLLRKSCRILQLLLHRSRYTPVLNVVRCTQNLIECPRLTQHLLHKVTSTVYKQCLSQSQSVSQSLWRPWI